tara:strand:+ start:32 stop:997 length:966 start_codon:yes stop_codon:yes gene_type:complete
MLNQKKIFITGGTGSFGSHFLKFLLKNAKPKKITIFSRDELKQHELKNDPVIKRSSIPIRFLIGDVRDKDRLDFAILDKPDFVVHASALKQVDTAEYNPTEFINTNIQGAQNLISSCLRHNIPKVIALSTDKASSPVNLYGTTKLVSDKLFIAANTYSKKTKLAVVRYGNVNFSRGSVIPILIKQHHEKKPFYLTDPKMTRFCINLEDSIKFVLNSYKKMQGGEMFVPKLKSYRLIDLARAINSNAKIVFTGIRPGEKIHEEMISITDALNTSEFKNYYVIYPYYKKKNKKILPQLIKGYSSDRNEFLTIKQLKNIIKNYK